MAASLDLFQPHQVDDLILLVGSNPLPNAVAACSLLKPGGRVHLIETERSTDVGGSLATWITEAGIAGQPSHILVRESDNASIFDAVASVARQAITQGHRVGLNYTGGTKAMSVHAYRAVESESKAAPDRVRFSYIDSRTGDMVIDHAYLGPGGKTPDRLPTKFVRSFRLQELTKIHGWALKSKTSAPLPSVARVFSDFFADVGSGGGNEWLAWIHTELLPKTHREGNPNGPWLSERQLRSLQLNWPEDSGVQAIVEALQEILGDSGASFNLGALAVKAGFARDDVEGLCKWLNGEWLDSYVFGVVQDLKRQEPIDCATDLVAWRDRGGSNETQFQIDVAAVRGYQLFALSCTTGRSDLHKQKLFEVFIRARQLGGDEARLGLVCFSNDPERLQRQLRTEFADNEEQIRVFGWPHFRDLATVIHAWITGWGD